MSSGRPNPWRDAARLLRAGMAALPLIVGPARAQAPAAPPAPAAAPAPAPFSAEVEAARVKAAGGDSADLLKFADGGDAGAQFLVGTAYMRGSGGLTRDPAKACAYEEKAAPTRADASHLVGDCYARGLGGQVDAAKAKAAYRRAADLGYGPSKCALGEMMLADPAEAPQGLALCREAADAGDAHAQAALGQAYREGRGIKADAKEARRWCEMAAAQKHPAGARVLGEMYLKGEGGKRDKTKAMELWRTAEAAGDPIAATDMADFMFAELTGGKTPGPGKFKIAAGMPVSRVDDVTAWYQEAAKRDPRPEARQRAELAIQVLTQLKVGLANAGHPQ